MKLKLMSIFMLAVCMAVSWPAAADDDDPNAEKVAKYVKRIPFRFQKGYSWDKQDAVLSEAAKLQLELYLDVVTSAIHREHCWLAGTIADSSRERTSEYSKLKEVPSLYDSCEAGNTKVYRLWIALVQIAEKHPEKIMEQYRASRSGKKENLKEAELPMLTALTSTKNYGKDPVLQNFFVDELMAEKNAYRRWSLFNYVRGYYSIEILRKLLAVLNREDDPGYFFDMYKMLTAAVKAPELICPDPEEKEADIKEKFQSAETRARYAQYLYIWFVMNERYLHDSDGVVYIDIAAKITGLGREQWGALSKNAQNRILAKYFDFSLGQWDRMSLDEKHKKMLPKYLEIANRERQDLLRLLRLRQPNPEEKE